jgi:predicted metal-dependent hydrolase
MTTATLASSATRSSVDRAPREIPVRRPAFDFARVRERYWFGGDPYQSHLCHALSLTFPDGERFFMDAVRHYLDRVESPALRHEISRFLAQEAAHGKAHDAFNDWVKKLGLDADWVVREIQKNLARGRTRPPLVQLAATAALEHFTAILAELMFSNEELREQMDPEMRRLWMWHAIEETEHKSVAFDTYEAVGGTYRIRAMVMAFTTVNFLMNVARFQAHLIKSDPAGVPLARTMLRGWFRLWVYPGVFLPLIPAYLDYFRPGFHPWQRKPLGDFAAMREEYTGNMSKGASS